MSALNQARLILGEQLHVTDREMERRTFDPKSAADLELVRMHLLGWVLEVLVDFSSHTESAT